MENFEEVINHKAYKSNLVEKEGWNLDVKLAKPDEQAVDMLFIVDTADASKWHEGFIAHAKSKDVAGLLLPVTRADLCDESRTKVFRSVSNPNRVAMTLYGVNGQVLQECMADPQFGQLTEKLGENLSTKKSFSLTNHGR